MTRGSRSTSGSTRPVPRNQGALTSWELGSHGIRHSYIVDNAGGHLMQRGLVDMVIVGTDRTTRRGDVCNKIGTYLKALAARDNAVPFYVALPSPTIDWTVEDGLAEIPIEERAPRETTHVLGRTEAGGIEHVQVAPKGAEGENPAFDVTPNHLVTRPHHRARGLRRERRGPRRPLPGAGRRGREDRVARARPPHEYTGRAKAGRALAPPA